MKVMVGLTTSALVSNSHSDSRVFWLRKAKLGLARIFSHEYSHSRVRVLQVSQVLMKILAKNDKKYILNFNLIIPIIIIIIIIMDPICWHTASTIIPDAAVLGCCHHVWHVGTFPVVSKYKISYSNNAFVATVYNYSRCCITARR